MLLACILALWPSWVGDSTFTFRHESGDSRQKLVEWNGPWRRVVLTPGWFILYRTPKSSKYTYTEVILSILGVGALFKNPANPDSDKYKKSLKK